jgi:hypothetical protein
MLQRALKLKQASAVLKVEPKELQNLVQFGVVTPKRVDGTYLFDRETLLAAKVAFRLKDSLGTRANILLKLIDVFRASEKGLRIKNPEYVVFTCRFSAEEDPIKLGVPFRSFGEQIETGPEQSGSLPRHATRTEEGGMEEGIPGRALRGGQRYRGDLRRRDSTNRSQLPSGKASAGDHRCSRSLRSENNVPWWTRLLWSRASPASGTNTLQAGFRAPIYSIAGQKKNTLCGCARRIFSPSKRKF